MRKIQATKIHQTSIIEIIRSLITACICSGLTLWWAFSHLGENLFSCFLGSMPIMAWILLLVILYTEEKLLPRNYSRTKTLK